jgi:elongation factor 3
VDPFLASVLGDKAAAVNEEFLGRCVREIASKDVEELEDNEGEDLCNCEFSLAYGGKILLSNTRLWLKRGRRYGLCGANGTGKVSPVVCLHNFLCDLHFRRQWSTSGARVTFNYEGLHAVV